jgi:branched-chain amino acid transport system substrate-binding protein
VTLDHTVPKGTDLADAAARARDSGAEALVVCGHYQEAVAMRRALHDLGWTPRAFYASVGPVLEDYHAQLGPLAQGVFSSTQWQYHEKLAFPGCQDFHQRFISHWGGPPSYHAATAYAAGQILATAVGKAGSLDRDRLRDVLAAMDTMTVIGRYGVDNTGMQVRHLALTIQWRDGHKEVAWPPELATREPLIAPAAGQ